MVKIHFLQKWSSFRKKITLYFSTSRGGGGPDPKVEISTFYFFLNPSLRDAFKKKNFGDYAQKEGGGQFQNPNIFTLKLGHFIEEGGVQSQNSQFL